MRKLIYSMSVSADGVIAGPNGEIDWSGPSEELHRFHNRQVGKLGMHLLGRRLYEEMLVWETREEQPSVPEHELEFARIWKQMPKVVFSTGRNLAVGGARLAATLITAGLVDEFRQFVSPVVLGAGTPFFPPLAERIELELVETRTFGSRVVYLRHRAR